MITAQPRRQSAHPSEIRIIFRRPERETPHNVWCIREVYESQNIEHSVPAFVIEDGCYSIYEPIGTLSVKYHHVGTTGTVRMGEVSKRVAQYTRSRVPCVSVGKAVRVRFNTEHIQNPRLLPWRVLMHDGCTYDEKLAASFAFEEGLCRSSREVLPAVGEKWHIGCTGRVVWIGTHARIISFDDYAEVQDFDTAQK